MAKKLQIAKAFSDLIFAIFFFLLFTGLLKPSFSWLGIIGASLGIVVNLIYIIKHWVKK